MAGTIFYDDFSGSTLNAAWQVLPGQGTYSLVGDLRYVNQGPASAPAGWSTTSLSLALPFTGTNWEADIKASFSLDWLSSGSYTGPPVPNYLNSSGAQAPQVMMSFDPVTAGDRSALAGGTSADFNRGTDAWYGYDDLYASYGSTSVLGLINPADAWITNNITGGTYWYQFIRNGGTLTMNYSYDGVNYFTALSAPLANPSGSYNELVLSGTTYSTAGSFADYYYVDITSPVPEPSTWGLLGLGLLGLVWAGRRRARQIAAL